MPESPQSGITMARESLYLASAFMKWRSLEEAAPQNATRSLAEIYAGRKELIRQYVPADISAVHARAVEELQRSGIQDRVPKSGDHAPAFELPDQDGKLVRSADLLARGPLVICFIRGRWCPFCVAQMEAMNAAGPQLEQAGAFLVGVSPQTVHQSFLMADQHKLRFPLLSDAGNAVARKFGLVYTVPDYQKQVYQRAFVNLPVVNGDGSWELPIPATFIVVPRGTIAFAHASADYSNRPEPNEIIALAVQLSRTQQQ